MLNLSERGSTFSKTVIILSIVGLIAGYGVYFSQKALNNIYADDILNGVWKRAKEEKKKIDPETSEEDEDVYVDQMERKGFGFSVAAGSTPTLIKVDTEKKTVSPGICRALKRKFKESMWWDAFTKVVVVDRMGDEKTDVLIYDCPHERIPALRFYVKFPEIAPLESEVTEEETVPESKPLPPPVSVPVSNTNTSKKVQRPSYTRSSCPIGTSENGMGGTATAGCRCNHSGESWNGNRCEAKSCPAGSSKNGTGNATNVPGCQCDRETPSWSATKGMCVQMCPGNKISDQNSGKCVCPENTVPSKKVPDLCVECNGNDDCSFGYVCARNNCVAGEVYKDCRWGVCQTCNEQTKLRQNIVGDQACETGGLLGSCNHNGTCYPVEGKRCSSVRGCPAGEFCNYGGTFNSSSRQQGKFGQTPNVCQVVNPEEFTYKNVTYYYNTEKDLKSWCRAANNKPNCLWGYLAKSGAASWCTSLGKRLLTKAEMAEVWDALKEKIPQTYKGYAYWVEEGVWIEDLKGRRGFGKGHPDGYGGRGGVVCK